LRFRLCCELLSEIKVVFKAALNQSLAKKRPAFGATESDQIAWQLSFVKRTHYYNKIKLVN
jgi:hypothetical protein